MRDLDAVDEQLRELGEAPRDRTALLARVLGGDRSRGRLEALLEDVAADAGASALAPIAEHAPPTPAFHAPADVDDMDDLDRDTDTDLSEDAAMMSAPSRDTLADRPEEPQDSYDPDLSPDSASAPAPAPDEGAGFAAMFDFTNPPPPRESMNGEGLSARAPLPQPEPESPFDAPPRSGSVYPDQGDEETTARRSAPPPPAPAAAADDDADVEEEDFELLVDDEDIIEIGEDEMQIIDDE